MTTGDLLRAALAASKAEGCTCDPEINLNPNLDGIHHATVRHDSWCRLLLAAAAATN